MSFAREREGERPVESRFGLQKLAHVADPREALPEVLRPVDAERDEQVFRRQRLDLAAAHADRGGPRPHALAERHGREAPRRHVPVQLHGQPPAAAREREVVLRAQEHLLLRAREAAGRVEALRPQKLSCEGHVFLAHDDVEVYEATEREVAVGERGERGAFVGEGLYAFGFEESRDV